jgi:hypothetical protein
MALSGTRQLIFVTGEPGIGKTALVEVFVSGLREPIGSSVPTTWLARGQCIEHYGAGEAYLPILEALGRLGREQSGHEIIALLQQHAPSWLVQLPSLLNPASLEELQRKTAGVTRERMLRELAEALEVITTDHPLVLVLEDLHWSDVSTLDLLSMLARRQEAARLLIIGTYRPVEVLTREHPLRSIKQELQVHGQCEELVLEFLSEAAVAEYLMVRFPGGAPLHRLARAVHQRTDGNPLFMVNVTKELVERGFVINRDGHWIVESEIADDNIVVPENLRQLIAQQLARVSPDEHKILEAASVAGIEFSAAAVAAAVEQSAEMAETYCDSLVRREQFLRAQGTREWPDGTVAARYSFIHALYQEVAYEQLSTSRRIRLHRQIGEREEQGYGEHTKEIAAELAMHFERGQDYQRAVIYRQQAGDNARRRNAYHEAASHFTRGVELLTHWPETLERLQHELTLYAALGSALVVTKGLGAHEVRRVYDHARMLCEHVGETPQRFPVLFGLSAYYIQQEEMQITRELAEEYLVLAEKQHDPAFTVAGCRLLVNAAFWSAQFVVANEYCKRAINTGYDPLRQQSFALAYGFDPFLSCLGVGAWTLWYLGHPEQALQRSQAALTLARELAHPYALAWMLNAASWMHFYRREGQAAIMLAAEAITLSSTQEFPHWLAMGQWMRGQALIEHGESEEGVKQLQRGLEAYHATGALIGTRGCGRAEVARGYERRGQHAEGLRIIEEALSGLNQVRHYEAEMYRIKGELLLAQERWERGAGNKENQEKKVKNQARKKEIQTRSQSEAEACFHKAIAVARQQSAKSWELRATVSLARLWQRQSKICEAHRMLSEVYNWFTEGFYTKDLQEAKALLEELGH